MFMKIKPLQDANEPKPTVTFGSVIASTSARSGAFGGWGVRITTR